MLMSKLKHFARLTVFASAILALLFTNIGMAGASSQPSDALQTSIPAIVFVSRRIPNSGTVYMQPNETGSQPGVGPYTRFQVAAPGKLIVREANGTLRTLIDGSNPTAASLNLIDVNAPDVSYDATTIVFAGLVAGSYDTAPLTNPNAWRIYTIKVDGTGLRQITFSDQNNLNYSQFGQNAHPISLYDDTDPAWLPDGRIVFSSTRWPSFAHYGGVRTSNLHIVNADGSRLHRITAERNGADRPQVDPVTGKIVYSRWWRNFRFAINSMDTTYVNASDPSQGYWQSLGLSADRNNQLVRPNFLWRNSWHAATINPDGTGLALWSGSFRDDSDNHIYGGTFMPNGDFVANTFPMTNMTEAAGFGTIRLLKRGPGKYISIDGLSGLFNQYVRPQDPISFGVFVGPYVTEPAALQDGRIVISWAPDHRQDYGIYVANLNGTGRTLIYDNPGTTELRARAIQARPLPPVLADRITQTPSLLPPREGGPYNTDGTFVFDALNVYANAPVDTDIVSAPPVGSAAKIRFFTDFQRTAFLASSIQDWPILLADMPVNPDGSVRNTQAPANLPLFEQLRSSTNTVPLTGGPNVDGAAHVTGLNYGRPGDTQRCVGCHTGHTLINVPANDEEAKWSNLAPGAALNVSSIDSGLSNPNGLIDRRVHMAVSNPNQKYWFSRSGQSATTQWVQLTFPVPVTIRTVRLYNVPAVDRNIPVMDTAVRLFSDAAGTQEVANKPSGPLSENGTNVNFDNVLTRVVRVEFRAVNAGTAGLAEVEVIARGEDPGATSPAPTVTPTAGVSTATATGIPPATSTSAVIATATNVGAATATNTPAPAATFTSTATNLPPSTFTAIPTNTSLPPATPSRTPTAILPTANPNAPVIAPAALTTERGTTTGSLTSLGTLRLSGTDDSPSEYVSFRPQAARYSGYLSYMVPGNLRSTISGLSLQVNFKSTSTAKQRWVWSVYDWNAKRWIDVGEISLQNQNRWQLLNFNIAALPQYFSSANEIRIQLRSINASSDARIDYQVLQLVASGPSAQMVPTLPPAPAPIVVVVSPTAKP